MAFGVTNEGFVVKRQEDIKLELQQAAQSIFGPSVDLDDRGPFGQFIGLISEQYADIWELAEQVYNSQYPDTSEGTSLDNVAAITGSVREKPSNSRVIGAILFGTPGTIIPKGSTASVSTNSDAKFNTDVAATIAPGVNSIQRLDFSELPEDGSFTINFDGQVTAALDHDATAGQIQTALEALTNIEVGDVTVTGDVQSGQVDVEFLGNLAGAPQPALVIAVNALTIGEVSQITCVADVAGNLDRTTFIIYDQNGSVGVWIDIDDSGSTIPPAALAADRALEVTGVATNDSDSAVAAAIAATLGADPEFGGGAGGAVLTVTDQAQGARVDVADVDTGFSFAVTQQGRDAGEVPIVITEPQEGALPQTTVNLTAQETGPVQAPSGTLTVIETPVTGWDSITNPSDADPLGENLETDPAFRFRRLEEIAIAGRATIEAIRSQVLLVEDVTAVVVFENDSFVTDVDGRPPKTVDIVVENGDDTEIAEKIFDVVAGGIATIGDVTEVVTDSQGFAQTIKFSRPTPVSIWVEVDLTVDSNEYPIDGDAQVEAALIAYGDGLGIGRDVVVHGSDSLECSISEIPGITDIVFRVGKTASPTTDDNVVIEPREVADFDTSRTTVTQI